MKRRFMAIVMLVVLSAHVCGCALLVGASAGAGGVIWAKGRLQEEMRVSIDKLHSATLSGLKRLDLPIVIDRKDSMSAKVESRFSDGTHVWVDLTYLTENSTRIVVRVGVLGDQLRSNKIMESIKRYL